MRKIQCAECGGLGEITELDEEHDVRLIPCPECDGTGEITIEEDDP